MATPAPIEVPPPNDRRGSRASQTSVHTQDEISPVGGPPTSPSPLQIRASRESSRKQSATKQPPDLSLLQYVSKPDSNLMCLICHCPFSDPLQLECEHIFCGDCLHTWEAQQAQQAQQRNRELADRKCPTCRTKYTGTRAVPKIIASMLDELVVNCPHTRAGCKWVDQRSNVKDHVMLYCEYTPVACSSFDCRHHIAQKDYHKGCLHYTVSCEQCHTSMMKKDLEVCVTDHQRTACAGRSTNCPHCSCELLRLDLKAHIKDVCGKVVVPCQGAIVGCAFSAERAEVVTHEKGCPMATMAPHFRDQQARIERNEARLEPLSRKVGILEDGLSNITNMLYPANANDSSYPVTNPLDPNTSEPFPPASLVPTPDFRLPPASFPPVPPNDTSQTPFQNPSQPPFDSQVHHLLTLHDSLREEVSRIANALTECEGRTNMMVINESQRVKDEMLHTNAAINGMRMQLHWLMSATLHQRTSSSASSSTGRAAASTSASGSGSAPTQGASRSGTGGTYHAPLRRLSDSTRQDTKL
ncbi:hypothetical protein K458DRAFT_297784 [Lentithecium fluviatile CBS 122367]|uniref:TRAF-type zinc finger protein n=1 Tax=Lentithecium fluviatile CBS 122367 TaxID=1168545 RepID=A0A6G1J7P9_9PLEO|nr:hypothetical protein K458DRAFT_297784 [Lentithecium fluviatile CBS 122367]